MMPTVIDSLVIELGLDPRQLNEGTRAALENFKRTQEEAKKGGAAVESEGKKVINYFESLKRAALGVTGVLLGGMGLKEFSGFLSNLDAATARVAKTMDVLPQELSAWQGVFEQTGGSAEAATSSLQALSTEINTFHITGQSGMLGVLTQLGTGFSKANGEWKKSTELFLDLADAVHNRDPAQSRSMLAMLGIDQHGIDVLMLGRHAIRELLQANREAGGTTKESASIADEYQKKLGLLSRTATDLGRTIFVYLAPALFQLIDSMKDLIAVDLKNVFHDVNWTKFGQEASIAVHDITTELKRIDWKAFGEDIATITGGALKDLAETLHQIASALKEIRGVFSGDFSSVRAGTVPGGIADTLIKIIVGPQAAAAVRFGSSEGYGGGATGAAPGYPTSTEEVRKKIRAAAAAHGVDPDIAIAVAEHEGLYNYRSTVPGEDSVGPFQLHYGGGLGDQFTKETGLDAHNAATLDAQIEWVMSHLRQTGWGPYHGAGKAGIGPRSGIGEDNLNPFGFPIGAPAAAMIKHSSSLINNGGGGTTHTVTVETGDIHINAPNARTNGDIGGEIGKALRRQASIASWNTGLV